MPSVEIDYPASGSNIPRQFLSSGTFAGTSGGLMILCTLRDRDGNTIATSTAQTVRNYHDGGTWTAAFSVTQDYLGASLTAVLSNPANPDASHQTTDLTIQGEPVIVVDGPLPRPPFTDGKGAQPEWGWEPGGLLRVNGRVCAGVGVLVTPYIYRRPQDAADGLLTRIGPPKSKTPDSDGRWCVSFNWCSKAGRKFLEGFDPAQGDKLVLIAAVIGRNGKNLGRTVWRLRTPWGAGAQAEPKPVPEGTAAQT